MINTNSATQIQNPVFEFPPVASADFPLESPKEELNEFGIQDEDDDESSYDSEEDK